MKAFGVIMFTFAVLCTLLYLGFRGLASHAIVRDDAHKMPDGKVMDNDAMF